jgi:membrane AbrB-like protein
MLACGVAAGLAFWRLGVMAPMILGATLSSALLHATGLVHGTLPPWLAIPGFVIIGALIGARFGTVSLKELASLLPIATAAFVASAGTAAAFAWLTAKAAGVSFGVAFIAFAPGGLEAMALLAVLLGLDPLFVGAHHMVRFMAVGLLLPLVIRLVHPERGEDR